MPRHTLISLSLMLALSAPAMAAESLTLEQISERLRVIEQRVGAPAAENPEAERVTIKHPRHGTSTQEELPRLTTRFIQDPDAPENRQEKLAWEKARAVTLDACNSVYRRLGVQLADAGVQSDRPGDQREPGLEARPQERHEAEAQAAGCARAGLAGEFVGAQARRQFAQGGIEPLHLLRRRALLRPEDPCRASRPVQRVVDVAGDEEFRIAQEQGGGAAFDPRRVRRTLSRG